MQSDQHPVLGSVVEYLQCVLFGLGAEFKFPVPCELPPSLPISWTTILFSVGLALPSPKSHQAPGVEGNSQLGASETHTCCHWRVSPSRDARPMWCPLAHRKLGSQGCAPFPEMMTSTPGTGFSCLQGKPGSGQQIRKECVCWCSVSEAACCVPAAMAAVPVVESRPLWWCPALAAFLCWLTTLSVSHGLYSSLLQSLLKASTSFFVVSLCSYWVLKAHYIFQIKVFRQDAGKYFFPHLNLPLSLFQEKS